MAEYIERDKLLDKALTIYRHDKESGLLVTHKVVLSSDVVMAPAADVAPVRHGRWVSVPHKLEMVCSVCNRDEPYKFADIDADVYDYCPHCGAKMDLEG